MAEYRGLTIRIGADTGSLTASLKAAQSAMAAAEKQANVLKRALVMDPGSKNAGALYIGELQSTAVAASARVRALKQEIEDIGNTRLKSGSGTIAELAKQTDDAALSARRAKEAYTQTYTELATLYTELTQLSKDYGSGIKFSHKDTNDIATIRKEYQLIAANNKSLISRESAEKTSNLISWLKLTFQDLSDAYDDARLVEQMHNDEVATANFEARVKQLSKAMADAARSDLSHELEEDAEIMDRLSSGIEQAQAKIRNVDAAMRLDPSSIELVAVKSEALGELQTALANKIEAVDGALAKLSAEGIDQLVSSTSNLAADTESARQEYVRAQSEVTRLGNEFDAVKEIQSSLRAEGKTFGNDWIQTCKTVRDTKSRLDEAKAALSEASTAYKRMKDANTFVELTNQSDELKNQVRSATAEVEKLNDAISSIAAEKVDNFNGSKLFRQWSEASENVENLSNGIRGVTTYASALDAALKLDPSNMDVIVQKAMILSDGMSMADEKVESLTSTMDSFRSAGIDRLSAGIADANAYLETARERAITAHEAVLKLMVERSGAGSGTTRSIREVTEELSEARKEAKRAENELSKAQEVVAYRKVRDDLIGATNESEKFRRSLQEIAEAHVAAAKGSQLSEEVDKASKSVERLATDTQRFSTQFKTLDSIFQLDTSDTEVASRRMQALQNAIELTEEKATELRNILSQYESAGIDKLAEGSKRTAEDVEQARQAFVDADAEVVRASEHYEAMRRTASQMAQDGQAHGNNWVQQARAIKEAKDALDDAKAAAEDAHAKFNEARDVVGYQNVRQQLDDATLSGKQLEAQLEKTREAAEKAAEESVKALKTKTSQDNGWTETSASIKAIATDAETAKARFDALDKALQLDPGNIEIISHRNEALSQAISLAEQEAKQLRATIAGFEARGIDKVAASVPSVTDALRKAEQKATDTAKEVARLEVELSQAKEGTEAYDKLSSDLEKARSAASDAEKAFEDMQSAVDMSEAEAKLVSVNSALTDLKAKSADAIKIDASAYSGWTEAKAKIQALASDASVAKSRFESLDKALKLDPGNMDLIRSRNQALSEAIATARTRVEELQKQLNNFHSKGIDGATKGITNVNKKIQETEAKAKAAEREVERLTQELEEADKGSTAYDEIAKDLDKAKDKASGLRTELEKLHEQSDYNEARGLEAEAQSHLAQLENYSKDSANGISTAFYQAMQQVAQYSKQAIQEVATASYQLEDAYTNMMKTVDGSNEQYQALKDSAVAASMQNPVSADQILNVEALGGQLGFAIDELEEFQRVANGLDISTNMTWEEASTNMAQFANIMKMNHDDIGRYGAAIVDLGNNFATTEADISDMAMRIAGAGATLGLSEADVLGLSTALTSMGLTAEAGGSSISQIMLKIDKAVANGTDGVKQFADQAGMSVDDFLAHISNLDSDALTEFAEGFGMTASELEKETVDVAEQLKIWADTAGYDSAEAFAAAWKESPITALQAVFSGMDAAAEDGTNIALLLDELNIKTIRQGDVARRLANNSGLLTDAVRASNAAWEENIALDTEVARRNQSLSGRMDVLKNSFTAIKTEIGEGLTPFVEGGIAIFSGLANALNGVDDAVKSATIGLIGMTVIGAGGVSMWMALTEKSTEFMGKLASSGNKVLEKIPVLFGKMKASATGATGAITSFVAAHSAAIAVVGSLAAIIGGLVIAEVQHRQRIEDFNSQIGTMVDTAKDASIAMGDAATQVGNFRTAASNVTVETITKDLQDFNAEVKNIVAPVSESNALLEEYQAVIDRLAGKGSASASEMATLDWALKGINDTLGTNYSAQDVLINKYKDEETEIENLKSHIDSLIDKRQQQAKIEAAQSVYTETLREQMELQKGQADAEKAYQVQLENTIKKYASNGQFVTESMLLDPTSTFGDTSLIRLKENADAAAAAVDACNDSLEYWKQIMREAVEEGEADGMMMRNLIASHGEWVAALQEQGLNLDYVATKMSDAGISSEDLQRIYNDTGVAFADMVAKSEGDMDALIAEILRYNKEAIAASEATAAMADEVKSHGNWTEALEKQNINLDSFILKLSDAGVTAEGLQKIYDDTGVAFADMVAESNGNVDTLIAKILEYLGLEVPDKKLGVDNTDANAKVDETDAKLSETDGKTVTPKIGADNDEAVKKAEESQKAVDSIEQKTKPMLDANNTNLIRSVQTAQGYVNSIQGKTVDITVNAAINGYYDVMNKLDNLISKGSRTITTFFNAVGKDAAGGIRYHADGFIADHPTWLSSHDIVGEAGAEAIIPLTNKKYVNPFAGAVADQMLSKMHGMDNGNVITVNLNYSAGDDANQMARDLARALGRIQRTGR